MKDFAAEIRAHLDVEQFLSQAQLMLDVHETNVECILDAMLHHLLDSDDQAGVICWTAMTILDSDDQSGIIYWTAMTSLVQPHSTTPRKCSSRTIPVYHFVICLPAP